jgi:hypothetical protein
MLTCGNLTDFIVSKLDEKDFIKMDSIKLVLIKFLNANVMSNFPDVKE